MKYIDVIREELTKNNIDFSHEDFSYAVKRITEIYFVNKISLKQAIEYFIKTEVVFL